MFDRHTRIGYIVAQVYNTARDGQPSVYAVSAPAPRPAFVFTDNEMKSWFNKEAGRPEGT